MNSVATFMRKSINNSNEENFSSHSTYNPFVNQENSTKTIEQKSSYQDLITNQ